MGMLKALKQMAVLPGCKHRYNTRSVYYIYVVSQPILCTCVQECVCVRVRA